MKGTMLYLWQLPQNLLGLLFLLFIRGEERHSLNGIVFYYAKGFNGGISLGRYIILSNKYEKYIRHEYGHSIQSRYIGWLYLLVIGVPSAINAMVCSDSKTIQRGGQTSWEMLNDKLNLLEKCGIYI